MKTYRILEIFNTPEELYNSEVVKQRFNPYAASVLQSSLRITKDTNHFNFIIGALIETSKGPIPVKVYLSRESNLFFFKEVHPVACVSNAPFASVIFDELNMEVSIGNHSVANTMENRKKMALAEGLWTTCSF